MIQNNTLQIRLNNKFISSFIKSKNLIFNLIISYLKISKNKKKLAIIINLSN